MKYWLMLGFYGGPEVQNTATKQKTQQKPKHINKLENTTIFHTFTLLELQSGRSYFWAPLILEIQVLFTFPIDNVM